MQKLFFLLIVFLFSLDIFAQDTLIVFFPNTPDHIQSWHLVKPYNGSKLYHGDFTIFYKNGKAQEIGSYSLGELHGNYNTFAENGTPVLSCRYTNGILNGEYKTYYKSGNLKERKLYINGNIQGEYRYYEDVKNSKPTQVVNYKMGVKLN